MLFPVVFLVGFAGVLTDLVVEVLHVEALEDFEFGDFGLVLL